VSDLARRLLRRATAPIGVIDARHAAELHARASLWPVRRLELVNELKTRYGLAQNGGSMAASSMPLMAPPGMPDLFASPPVAAGTSAAISPTETAGPFAEPPSSPPSPSSPPRYRVRRRGANAESDSSAADPAPALPPGAAGLVRPEQANDIRAVDGSPASQVAELPRTFMALQLMPGGSTVEQVGATPSGVATAAMQDGFAGDNALPAMSAAPARVPAAEYPLAVAPAAPPASADTPTLPLAPVSAPSLQRKADHSSAIAAETAAAAPTVFAVASPTIGEAHSRGPTAAEVRVAPALPAATSIVWRKAEADGASRNGALDPASMAAPQIMRTAEPGPGSTGPPPTLVAGDSGTNIARIAEQVSRVIARRLRVELERRGRTR
jgi:hypothetical protein